MVWNPLDLTFTELVLGGLSQFSTMLTKHAVSALGGVHPDAVIVVSKCQVVWFKLIEEFKAHLIVLRNPICFLLWATASTERREIPQVTEVDLVVGLPAFSEVEYLLFSFFRD